LIRLLLDSNVLISALVFGGLPRLIVASAEGPGAVLVISLQIIREVEGVLRRKFRWEPDRIAAACRPIWTRGHVLTPSVSVEECRDPNDNHVLALALSANADVIVTGDADLLALHPFRGIPILTPSQALPLLRAQSQQSL
jgi:uncharacterized protein